MVIKIITLLFMCFVFFGLLHSILEYFEHLDAEKIKELRKDKEAVKEAAINRECKRVRRFLMPDGETVDTRAATAYIENIEKNRNRSDRLQHEYLDFEVIL